MYQWTEKGIPHKDWICSEVYDLEEACHTCEMCSKEEIRYVHVMYHNPTGLTKQVGCVCAAAMALESVGEAKDREQTYKNMFKRRETFMKRWEVDAYGRAKVKTKDKEYYTLYPQFKGGVKVKAWVRGVNKLVGLNNRYVGDKDWASARLFNTEIEAKRYIFEIQEGRVELF